jgi:hypothetical protein
MFVHFLDLRRTSQLKSFAMRLIGEENSRDEALDIGAGRLFLVEAKRLDTTTNLAQHMPEAVSQAVVLAEHTKHGILLHEPDIALLISRIQAKKRVRFCLSNGCAWILAILEKGDNGERVYYRSAARFP